VFPLRAENISFTAAKAVNMRPTFTGSLVTVRKLASYYCPALQRLGKATAV
jgi:hypothetical protein